MKLPWQSFVDTLHYASIKKTQSTNYLRQYLLGGGCGGFVSGIGGCGPCVAGLTPPFSSSVKDGILAIK